MAMAQVPNLPNLAASLQDNRVSDADLLEALVEEFYSGLYALALSVLLEPRQARLAVVQALAVIAAHRREYWGEQSLVVWINRLALEHYHKPGWSWPWALLNRSFKGEKKLTGYFQHLTCLDELERVILALRYGQRLSLEDISAILDASSTRVQIYLKVARKAIQDAAGLGDKAPSEPDQTGVTHTAIIETIEQAADGVLEADQRVDLERHLGECPPCREKAVALMELENHIREGISNEVVEEDSAKTKEALLEQSLVLLNSLQRTRHFSISARQLLLTALLVIALAGLGWRYALPQILPALPASPTTTTVPTSTPDPWAGYLKFAYSVSQGETLESLAELTGLQVQDILTHNNITLDTRINSYGNITLALPEAAFVPPQEREEIALPSRLTADADPLAIRQRLAQGEELFNTLWGDFLFVVYGPPGYSGPPFHKSRVQFWVTREGYAVQLSGVDTDDVSFKSLLSANHFLPNGMIFFHDSANQVIGQNTLNQEPYLFFQASPVFWSGDQDHTIELRVAGTDQVLGRPVLVLDFLVQDPALVYRMWVDAERGLILRARINTIQGEVWTTVMEYGFTALALDVDLPPEVFSPFSFTPERFVVDQNAEPLPPGQAARPFPWSVPLERRPKERLSPPQGFDPSREVMTLQWPLEWGEAWDQLVDVFAGQYYLGSLPFGQRLKSQDIYNYAMGYQPLMACTRSPDGRLVAVSIKPYSSNQPNLYWFELTEPVSAREIPIAADAIYEFAFDPSSRYLAYYGCPEGSCGVQLLDTYTEKVSLLTKSIRAAPASLTWSPDGRYLAMLSMLPGSNIRQIIVVDRFHGNLVYHADYGWTNPTVPADSPTLTWGRPFPVEKADWIDLYGCAFPYEYPELFENNRWE
jgi:hypothetical protein